MVVMLVGAPAMGAPAGGSQIASTEARSGSRAVRALVGWVRAGGRSAGTSVSRAGPTEIICRARNERSVKFLPGAGLAPLPWGKPGPRGVESIPPGLAQVVTCSTSVYRRFFAGRDTVSFTEGISEEECADIPRLLLQYGRRPVEKLAVPPLGYRNVECLWSTPRYLIFGLVHQGEGGPEYDRVACWRIGTGEWIWTPERDGLAHRPGFDLASLVPDWRTAAASEAGEAIVMRGKERAIALWPGDRSWSLVDATTGSAIAAPRRELNHKVIEGKQVHLHPQLRSRIQAEFRKRNRAFDPFEVLEMITVPCRAHRASCALIAHSIVHGAARRGVQDRVTGKFRWQDEMFGVFLVDSKLTSLEATLGMFPTQRWLDETAYFDTDAPDDSIVVWPEGETYGDPGPRLSYPCAP